MNVYRGIGKRQVGSGIWSTIQRGFRPLLSKIASTLKPHAIAIGKRALGVGSTVAMDALSGKINKNQIKQVLKDEALKLREEAKEKMSSLKRKYIDNEPQEGSGIPYKRRRKSTPKKHTATKKKMVKKVYKRKACKKSKCKGQKPKRKQYKRRAASKSKKGRITKRKRKTVSRKAVKDIFG